jgi:peptidoglycan/xylan/chitin deacetylase (PgdA/CDA1 family)
MLTPDDFRRALEVLLDSFGPALDPSSIGPSFVPPDRPSVLVTFDDGYRDNLEAAAPIMAEFDVRMLLFCVTDRIVGTGTARRAGRPTPHADYLTWAEVVELQRLGHVLGAHTRSHRRLSDLAAAEAAAEVVGSLVRVREMAGPEAAPPAFAYPFGLVPARDVVPPGVLGFGTVKSPPRPWTSAPHQIRRSYLPAGDTENWPDIVRGWERQWHASRS